MSGFDKLARPYRWMEYLSFGHALERCRFAFLPDVRGTRLALLLGDGDGRFTAALLREAHAAHAVAVDGSSAMLRTLRARCEGTGVADRLAATVHADLGPGLPASLSGNGFDLVATHFFLDCLTDAEAEHIARDVTLRMTCDARWIVSEFAVPECGAMRLPSQAAVRLLYLAFRMLTGLRPRRLPRYRAALQLHGWRMERQKTRLGGLLVSELWQRAGREGLESGER